MKKIKIGEDYTVPDHQDNLQNSLEETNRVDANRYGRRVDYDWKKIPTIDYNAEGATLEEFKASASHFRPSIELPWSAALPSANGHGWHGGLRVVVTHKIRDQNNLVTGYNFRLVTRHPQYTMNMLPHSINMASTAGWLSDYVIHHLDCKRRSIVLDQVARESERWTSISPSGILEILGKAAREEPVQWPSLTEDENKALDDLLYCIEFAKRQALKMVQQTVIHVPVKNQPPVIPLAPERDQRIQRAKDRVAAKQRLG